MVKFIQGIVDEIGKPKFAYESSNPDPEILKEIEDFCIEDVKKHSTPMISSFATKLCFRFMRQFMKNLTKNSRAAKLKSMKLCILFKSMLFVLGLKMSISV